LRSTGRAPSSSIRADADGGIAAQPGAFFKACLDVIEGQMQKLFIIKAGATFPATRKQFGDFDTWTLQALGSVGVETCIRDVQHGDALPAPEVCAGAVITGSHAMVTENLPWSVRLEKWIPSLLSNSIPLLGICYGHQLLARAGGGRVATHPRGMEIGTVAVDLLAAGRRDALFASLPPRFDVHVTHAQTVLRLPPEAVRLAANDYEPHHAFRLGDCAWGVQFHPEFSAAVTRSYIQEQAGALAAAGCDIARLRAAVAETTMAAKILENFAGIVNAGRGRSGSVGNRPCPVL
jgi:GMP synthase (glutamine-hydrolysing)